VEQLEARTLLSVYTPAQIRTAYQFNQTSYTGAGQTIAIVDAYSNPNISADLATFDRQWGVAAPPSFKVVNQNGGTQPPPSNSGWWLEIALDVEWAHAIAPGANILLVEANSNYYSDLLKAVDYAAAHANVVSMSWGSGEFSAETWNTYDGHFANHPGVTFVASAGDSGAPPEWPSISPNVVSVGGTTLRIQSNGTYISETGWGSGGGGISAFEPKPSYQSSVTQSATNRTSPDVAYDGDPSTGFYVYDASNGGWWQVGGTSAGAPQWAALIALADQGRAANGKSDLSSTDTLTSIYAMPAGNFHDITSGYNGNLAGSGYDLVTGRGSPIANLVINSLVNYASGASIKASPPASATTSSGSSSKGVTRSTPNVEAVIVLSTQPMQEQQVAVTLLATPEQTAKPVPLVPITSATTTLPSMSLSQANMAGGVVAPPDALVRPTAKQDAGSDRGIVPAEYQDDSEQIPPPAPANESRDMPKLDGEGVSSLRSKAWLLGDSV
jgi:subtilase family serine protease